MSTGGSWMERLSDRWERGAGGTAAGILAGMEAISCRARLSKGLAAAFLAFAALTVAAAPAGADPLQDAAAPAHPPMVPPATSPPAMPRARPDPPPVLIQLADPSEAVYILLINGHSAAAAAYAPAEGDNPRACFVRGRDLFRQGLREAQKRHEPKSEAVARNRRGSEVRGAVLALRIGGITDWRPPHRTRARWAGPTPAS